MPDIHLCPDLFYTSCHPLQWEMHLYATGIGSWHMSSLKFPWASIGLPPDSMSIDSAVFAQLTCVSTTDTQTRTHTPCYVQYVAKGLVHLWTKRRWYDPVLITLVARNTSLEVTPTTTFTYLPFFPASTRKAEPLLILMKQEMMGW